MNASVPDLSVDAVSHRVKIVEAVSHRVKTFFLVKGRSMEPVLKTGDRVTLRPAERGRLRCGDIVVFKAESGREVIHRVVGLAPLRTRGDNCRRDDAPVPEESPLSLAVSVCRNGRVRALTSGSRGLREFRRNQFRCKLFAGVRKVLLPLANRNPFRIPFNRLRCVPFAGKVVYYAGKRPVGWTDAQGWHWMRFARYFVEARGCL